MSILSWISDAIMQIAWDAVNSIFSGITNSLNQVTGMVADPLKVMVQSVTGGIWKGKGADAFVSEMNGVVLKQLQNMLTNFGSFGNGLKQTMSLMDQVNSQVTSAINGLGDAFNAIF